MQEPDIPLLFETISKAESPLSFFGDEVPIEAISDNACLSEMQRDLAQ
jgi:hypothetical protein